MAGPRAQRPAAPAASTASADRTAAEALRGTLLLVDIDPAELPEDDDEWYDHQLVGLQAVLLTGARSGRSVTEVAAPARRRTCWPSDRGAGAEVLVPFVLAIVPEVDVAARRVVVDPPPGLVDDEGRRADVRIDVVTIFPEYLAPLGLSLLGKAQDAGLLEVGVHDLRAHTDDRHRTVDDTPYGGGAGMVMRPRALGRRPSTSCSLGADPTTASVPRLVVPTPPGEPFRPRRSRPSSRPSRGWSSPAGATRGSTGGSSRTPRTGSACASCRLGDYVLGGGEVAVLVIVEAVARLLPGVLGNAESLAEESHADGLLEDPVYTKPPRGAGSTSRRCCSAGTTAGRRLATRDERCGVRRPCGPTCWPRSTPPRSDQADLAVLAALGWTVGADGRVSAPG